MIFDSIANKARYKSDARIYHALCYLERIHAEDFPSERKTLAGVVKYILYRTKPENEAIFEVHHLLGDIHYMVEGVEGFQTANASGSVTFGAFSEEQDFGECQAEADGTIWLTPGCFAIVFPDEIHKTGICREAPAPVKKVVYKF